MDSIPSHLFACWIVCQSLAVALEKKSLGALNPTPWGIMTGNCFGWLAYAYYSGDPFVLASNIPGILVSFWLNSGASKLQFYAEIQSHNDSSEQTTTSKRAIIFTPQDKLMLGVLSLWIFILVCVGWLGIGSGYEKEIVGILVNINLLFFYGAPLQTIKTVVAEKCSDSIHTPTVILNLANAGLWGAYGIAVNKIVIYGPNGIGFLLGSCQAALLCMYPKTLDPSSSIDTIDDTPLLNSSDDGSVTDVRDEDSTEPPSQVV